MDSGRKNALKRLNPEDVKSWKGFRNKVFRVKARMASEPSSGHAL